MAVLTTESFFEVLAESNLLFAEQLAQARESAQGETDPRLVARGLIRQGLLTLWQAQQLLAGRRTLFFGNYRVIGRMAAGARGVIYKAQRPDGMPVAVKVLTGQLQHDEQAKERFRRESEYLGALRHPNIVRAMDMGQEGHDTYLVMEYIDGPPLARWIEQQAALPIDWTCEVIGQAAEGLDVAHSHGIVHRNVNPNHLFVATGIDEQPVAKLIDWSYARRKNEVDASAASTVRLTRPFESFGEPDYIAPEQAEHARGADAASDIFSLGCVLYTMLAGQVPFGGSTPFEKMVARATADAAPVAGLRRDVPDELSELVAQMLIRKVDQRKIAAAEVARRLAPFGLRPSGAILRNTATPPAGMDAARTTRALKSGPLPSSNEIRETPRSSEASRSTQEFVSSERDSSDSTEDVPVRDARTTVPDAHFPVPDEVAETVNSPAEPDAQIESSEPESSSRETTIHRPAEPSDDSSSDDIRMTEETPVPTVGSQPEWAAPPDIRASDESTWMDDTPPADAGFSSPPREAPPPVVDAEPAEDPAAPDARLSIRETVTLEHDLTSDEDDADLAAEIVAELPQQPETSEAQPELADEVADTPDIAYEVSETEETPVPVADAEPALFAPVAEPEEAVSAPAAEAEPVETEPAAQQSEPALSGKAEEHSDEQVSFFGDSDADDAIDLLDPELAYVNAHWNELPPILRQAILAMMRSVINGDSSIVDR